MFHKKATDYMVSSSEDKTLHAAFTRTVFASPAHAERFSIMLTLMDVFTEGGTGSLAAPATTPCQFTNKTATAGMPHNGFDGHVLLWKPSDIRCFPRAARGDLTRRAQLVVDELLEGVEGLCVRLGFPHFMAVRATEALTKISRVLSCTVLSYDLSELTDEHVLALESDLQADQGFSVTLNFLLQDFVALVAKWEEPAISALLLTLTFNLQLCEGVDPSEAMAIILNSILANQGREDELWEYVNWYCETFDLRYEELFAYIVLEVALTKDGESSTALYSPQSPLFY
ncbi:hypothetical protein E2C01_047977 [Portunus trituberculatus]|uniref:Uncharacterized protein n=1 Tax=Portunus trituberculatus TaxID=210409 RepID=A0A5B7G1X7_PORTR|nr:hypothetical protein [Portunus trituberculatus]